MDLVETECGAVEWFSLAQDRDQWLDIVNMKRNLRVS
jgi:hypothetical protein